MRYWVKGAGIIRSENAAKPAAQKSKYVTTLIRGLDAVDATLDYGAGKLRYLDELRAKTNELFVTDSVVQLDRKQRIANSTQSVSEYCSSSNTVTALNLKQLGLYGTFVDRAFLFNVLQIVPIPAVRNSSLRRIFSALRPGGELVASVQYRNSDFTRMAKMRNARSFRDGFLIEHLRGTSFYGLIRPEDFTNLIENAGFEIREVRLNDGSCFVFAMKPSND